MCFRSSRAPNRWPHLGQGLSVLGRPAVLEPDRASADAAWLALIGLWQWGQIMDNSDVSVRPVTLSGQR